MLTVVASFKVKKGKENQVKQLLLGLISPTHAEKDCIDYDLHVCRDDPSKFLFYENWVSRESLDQHLQTPHLKDFASQADELLEEPVSITFWDCLNAPKREKITGS